MAYSIKNKEINEHLFQYLFHQLPVGFALCELVHDSHEKPIDYQFLATNLAFKLQSGLKASVVVGKSIKEIYPDIKQSKIDRFVSVVVNMESVQFEEYNHDTDKYYRVSAFSASENKFAMVFEDILKEKQVEKDLKIKGKSYEQLLNQ